MSDLSTDDLKRWYRRYGPAGPDVPEPVVPVRAEGAWLEDTEGRRYLDFASGGFVPLGYNHPDIARVLQTVSHRPAGEGVAWPEEIGLMHKLAEIVPGGMNRRVLLCDSGREAMAKAVALAQRHTKRARIVYLADISGENVKLDADVAAVVAHPLDPRLVNVRKACTDAGALLIDDETGIGPGLAGTMLGIEGSQVRPDMYVLGRGWAAGVPFGACVTGSSALHWDAAGAGSPGGSAVALEVIRLLESGLLEQVKPVAAELERRLTVLCSGAVAVAASGQGLFWTLLFASGKKVATGFAARCREAGLLLRVLGDDTVGIRPPLVVTEEQVVDAIGMVERVLSTFGEKR